MGRLERDLELVLSPLNIVMCSLLKVNNLKCLLLIIDQAQIQDGWLLGKFSFCVFMDWDEVKVHRNTKREQGQDPAILTELGWSIKHLFYGIKNTEKNDLSTFIFEH